MKDQHSNQLTLKLLITLKLLVAICLTLLLPSVQAKVSAGIFGSYAYESEAPTVQDVLGYQLGEKITWSADARTYFEALQAYSPDRVKIVDYGTSWEGRTLFYAVISSVENMAQLAEIQSNNLLIADPRQLTLRQASALIEKQPGITWLSYSVHGNEISSTDAAMATAYHLVASVNDPVAAKALSDSVVILVPVQNPDGRDRFVHHFEMARGILPDANMASAEHDEPWPGGRTNHYLFDLNRDWFAQTQPETRAHAKAFLQWMPLAFVDAHEMGSNSTYFFAPEADPYNPQITDAQRQSLVLFGQTNAKRFDAQGIDYFTREVFDAFYPGYGASWPTYHGSIAMTYEQASSRGLVATRYDGTQFAFAETVRNHFLTSLGTIETVSTHRETLLKQFYEYRRSAIEEGEKGPIKSYVFPAVDNSGSAFALATVLARQGIDVYQASQSFNVCGSKFASGSYFVNLNQPEKRLIQTLLATDVALPEAFVAEEQDRSDRGLGSQVYDVTAWSLPLMFDVQSVECSKRIAVAGELFSAPSSAERASPWIKAQLSYLVPWGSRAANLFMTQALRAGVKMKGTDLDFNHQGRAYGRGTLVINVHQNSDSIHTVVKDLVAKTGAEVVAVDDSWITEGPNFGSSSFVAMNAPKVAMVWDEPTNPYSAGSTRFVLEQMFEYPVTVVRASALKRFDLDAFDVLLIPDGKYQRYLSALGGGVVDRLRDWVAKGGVLISLANATSFLAHPEVDLLSIRRERLAKEIISGAEPTQPSSADSTGKDLKTLFTDGTVLALESYEQQIANPMRPPKSVSGAIVQAQTDGDHWISVGLAKDINVLVRGSAIYTPSRLDHGVNAVRFSAADKLLRSGFLWDWNRQQLAFKPYVVVEPRGDGLVIGFTQDPNFRAQQYGLNTLFLNAIFRGASYAKAGGK